ncbi:MAG: hypothetical protein FGM57_00105 [Candidatus Taylorbacteria bacterium]|nr:hypothetical protein [Candidatus Taylorbacteria bacterium]
MKHVLLLATLFLCNASTIEAAVSYGGSAAPTGYSSGGGSFVFPTQVLTATTSSASNTVQASSSIQAPVFFFYSYLRPGSRGLEVSELQKRLVAEKYMTGPVTGFFGTKTFQAVTLFQKENGIPAIGFVGPLTRAVLNSR